MDSQPPEPPMGIGDLHSQPGMESDAGLYELQEVLEAEISDAVFDRLTRFASEDAVPNGVTDAYREDALEYVTDCIAYREAIRPDSLRERSELPMGIARSTVGSWVWYQSGSAGVEHDRPESDADTHEHGKYLFSLRARRGYSRIS